MKYKVKVFFLIGWLLAQIHGHETSAREPVRYTKSLSENKSLAQHNSTMSEHPQNLNTPTPVLSDIQIVPGVERMPHDEYSNHHDTHLPTPRSIDDTVNIMDFLPSRRINNRGPIEDEPINTNAAIADQFESSRAFDQPNDPEHTFNSHEMNVNSSESSRDFDQPRHSEDSPKSHDGNEPSRTYDYASHSDYTPPTHDMHVELSESTKPSDQTNDSGNTPSPHKIHDESSLQPSDQTSYSGYTSYPHDEHVALSESLRPDQFNHSSHTTNSPEIHNASSFISEENPFTTERIEISKVYEEESNANEKLGENPIIPSVTSNGSNLQNNAGVNESYQEDPEDRRPFERDTPDYKESIFTDPEDIHENHEIPESATSRSSGKRNLCLVCFCDTENKKVYCKHEHIYGGGSHHLTLKKELIPENATFLHLEGFDTVTIPQDTFASQHLELHKIVFEDIMKINLSKGSLAFSPKARENHEVAIVFKKCKIEELPTEVFTQHARSETQASDKQLEETRFLSLHIENCDISTIRYHALYRARIFHFNMIHTKVTTMEEESIHLDIYENWLVEYSELPLLPTRSICVRAQGPVVFSKNILWGLKSKAIEIDSSNQVLFKYNEVKHLGPEALLAIQPNAAAVSANIVFLNNTVVKADNQSLLISNRYPVHERRVLENRFNFVCDCEIGLQFQGLMGITENSNHFENATYKAVLEESLCRKYEDLILYINIDKYLKDNCFPVPLPIVISSTIVAVAVIVTIVVCIVCSKRAARAKEEAYLGESCFSNSFSTLHSNHHPQATSYGSDCHSWERCNNLQPWVMAVPEVKTYQETEVHVLYEHTEPMNVSIRGSCHDPKVDLQRQVQVRASCPFN
ncbi:uncharacterized protein LOC119582673 [Penaeus monodon]|uniref:uncharacterized protein LOC119582673 n=1 Tax=Penaeus monodon TaxID=6687 RepID=UPI0018A71E04|nr:uncharacterized protein LOC119582673 [Penaeus monodon]